MPLMLSQQGMNNRNNVMVFIDGDHIRRYTKEKYGTDEVNYDTLGRKLALNAVGSGLNLIRIYYYDAVPDIKDADKIPEGEARYQIIDKISNTIKEQEQYFEKINKQEFVTIRKGRLVFTPKESPRQKGVDILMSIDMLTAAFERQYDWAVLVAGDSDFVDLVNAVKHTGANIMGSYFKKHVAKELVDAFDKRFELDGLDFKGNRFI